MDDEKKYLTHQTNAQSETLTGLNIDFNEWKIPSSVSLPSIQVIAGVDLEASQSTRFTNKQPRINR
jgi:hypothetical protein